MPSSSLMRIGSKRRPLVINKITSFPRAALSPLLQGLARTNSWLTQNHLEWKSVATGPVNAITLAFVSSPSPWQLISGTSFSFHTIFIHTIFHRVRVVNSWRDRDVNQIIQYHPDGVFTSFDPVDRRRILWNELTNMDILDAAGSEIPIYCGKGFSVPRRIPRFSRNTLPHGVLMDLRSVKDLFQTPWEDDIDLGLDDEDSPDITCYTYPQAGLKVAGHFQAAGLMKKFSTFVKAVNQDLIGDEDDLTSPPIVSGIACQGYNAVMHSTRGNSAQHHDAQLGLITGALAGSWAKGGPAERTAHRLSERCSRKLPHASFAEKIQNDLILRDLRLENVFYIDVQALKPHHQHGM